jgi:hypothetical protein
MKPRWISLREGAEQFAVELERLKSWVASGRVAVHPSDPSLVSLDELEEVAEQHSLFTLAAKVVERIEL